MKTIKFTGVIWFLVCAILNGTQAGGVDVLTSRNDNERTGANLKETILNVRNVRTSFGRLGAYDLSLDGELGGHVYAQPLYVSSVMVPGRGLTNILLVATTNNFVFAFDADAYSGQQSGNRVVWSRRLGTPPTMPVVWAINNCPPLSAPGDPFCNPLIRGTNIEGGVGAMSTPVIDRSRGIIFLATKILQSNPPQIVHRLHALDLTTGSDLPFSPAVISGRAFGVQFNPNTHNQRVGLALAKGQVIVSFGSFADMLAYRGWVMSFRYEVGSGFAQTGTFLTTPNGSPLKDCAGYFPILGIGRPNKGSPEYIRLANNCARGGIWMAGRAPAIDSNGNVLLMTGNGKADMTATGLMNFGNSLVKLDPVNLVVLDSFTPSNHIYLNAADLDFGGSGPMVIPQSRFIVGGGKQGFMYVWSADNLGKFRPGDPFVVQMFPTGDAMEHPDRSVDRPGGIDLLSHDSTRHPGHIMGGPVFWSMPPGLGPSRLYNWSEWAKLQAYSVNLASPTPVNVLPIATGPNYQAGHPGGILSLSANGSDLASGIVWAATYDPGPADPDGHVRGALNYVRHGTLRAYSALTLELLWHSDLKVADNLGSFAKFTPPTICNGRVYMATFANQVVVYGLLNHQYTRPGVDALPGIIQILLDDDEKP